MQSTTVEVLLWLRLYQDEDRLTSIGVDDSEVSMNLCGALSEPARLVQLVNLLGVHGDVLY